jgi:arabinose-5-phosphate isomerase
MDQAEIINEAKQVIQKEAEGVLTLLDQIDENFVKAAQKILDCKGHVLVSGSGTSHAVARRMAHLLSCCGTPALPLDAGDSQHGLAGAIMGNDILIALSKGGRTAEVISLAKVARERGAGVIAITENPGSELVKLSDIVLKITAPAGVDPYGMVATGSSLFNCAFGDALCVVLLKLRGYSVEQFGQTHPGGAVGKKLEDMKIL